MLGIVPVPIEDMFTRGLLAKTLEFLILVFDWEVRRLADKRAAWPVVTWVCLVPEAAKLHPRGLKSRVLGRCLDGFVLQQWFGWASHH